MHFAVLSGPGNLGRPLIDSFLSQIVTSNSYVDDLLKLIAECISKSFGPSIYFTGNNTCHPKKSDHSSVQQPASEIVPHSNSEDP